MDANAVSWQHIYGIYLDFYDKLTYELFHLFGDPEMWIWTEEPKKLEVTHPSKIGSGGLQEFVVNATDENGNPVHNAAVCLRKSNDIHTVKYTNPNGTVIFEIEPSTGGNMDITVTAHNHRPYEGNIEVTYNGANISLSPNIGPEGIHFTMEGNNFSNGEEVDIYFGDVHLDSVTATGGSFSEDFTVPDVPEGPTNVVAIGKDSGRAAVAVFRVMPDQPLPDPYTYCQWDSSTWHLANGEKKWDSPSIQLYEDGTEVESKDLIIGTTYTIKATIYNSGIVPADETEVTFKWAQYGAGQKVWNAIGTKTVDVPASGSAEASVEWTPITTGHVCIRVEIYHLLDSNPDNNKGQENTKVANVSSPGEVEFIVENPTNKTGLVYLELTQTGRERGEPIWGTEIEREYPQILKPGGSQEVKVRIDAPDDAKIGDSRTFSIDAILDGEVIGGIEFDAVVNHPPVLEPYVPQSGVVGKPVKFAVKYVDEDNHPSTERYPKLSILKDGVPVEGNPFEMSEEDPTYTNYSDGKFYTYSTSFSEPGEYIYFIYAYDDFTCSKVKGTIVITPTEEKIFDTGAPENPYPSISGTHNGTITPSQTITVNRLYTYPCPGTGGHTEYAKIWNDTIGECAVAEWNGYIGDYHNISFNKTLTLEGGVIYNYTIRTGSYPQIIHESPFNAIGGEITCTEFVDANGRVYYDWIPAIKLWYA